jgi:hypothetical protein
MSTVLIKPINSGIILSGLAYIVIKENMEYSLRLSSSSREILTELTKYIKNEEAQTFLKNSDYRTFNLIVSKFGDDVPTKALFEFNSKFSPFGSRKYLNEAPYLIPSVINLFKLQIKFYSTQKDQINFK